MAEKNPELIDNAAKAVILSLTNHLEEEGSDTANMMAILEVALAMALDLALPDHKSKMRAVDMTHRHLQLFMETVSRTAPRRN